MVGMDAGYGARHGCTHGVRKVVRLVGGVGGLCDERFEPRPGYTLHGSGAVQTAMAGVDCQVRGMAGRLRRWMEMRTSDLVYNARLSMFYTVAGIDGATAGEFELWAGGRCV